MLQVLIMERNQQNLEELVRVNPCEYFISFAFCHSAGNCKFKSTPVVLKIYQLNFKINKMHIIKYFNIKIFCISIFFNSESKKFQVRYLVRR